MHPDIERAQVLIPSLTDSDGNVISSELHQFAPRFVVWPEGRIGDDPPWPGNDRPHDYHPRAVSIFTEAAKLRDPYRLYFGGLLWGFGLTTMLLRVLPAIGVHLDIAWVLKVAAGVGAIGLALAFVLRLLSEDEVLFGGVVVVAIGVLAFTDGWGASGRGGEKMAQRLAGGIQDGRRGDVVTLDAPADPRSAWKLYTAIVDAEAKSHPRTVYGRAFEGPSGPVLQYWLFFFYNHWRNVHEADWEVVTILLDPNTRQPVQIGLSSHEDGLRRPWGTAEERSGYAHVYVARGSHALYFTPRSEGYDATIGLSVENAALRLALRGAVGSERDLVASAEVGSGRTVVAYEYQIVQMPDPTEVSPDNALWKDFWWLRYCGGWGRVATIKSPWASETARWEDPASWVCRMPLDAQAAPCLPDRPSTE